MTLTIRGITRGVVAGIGKLDLSGPLPDADLSAINDEQIAHATQPRFVYTRRWRPRNLVMWDNRRALHRGTDFGDLCWVCDMRCATVRVIANTCERAGTALPA